MRTNETKSWQRILSLVLTMAILLSIVPVSAYAVETQEAELHAGDGVFTILAASDFQERGNTLDQADANGAANVRDIAEEVVKEHSIDAFFFCGDYTLTNENADATQAAQTALVNSLNSSGVTTGEKVFIQGNHDPAGMSFIKPTGGYVEPEYAFYVLNEDDWSFGGGEKSAVQNRASDLDSWLSGLTVGQKPVFILSHVPLHYSLRSRNAKDGLYAEYLVDVLNKHGQRGLNIIFLFGHNHSGGYDAYIGGSTDYVARGDTLWICDPVSNWLPPKGETINFTYMNAGYVGYYEATPGVDAEKTMSVFEIVGDDVTISRYDADGRHGVKPYAGNWTTTDANESTYGHQLNLAVFEDSVSIPGNDFAVSIPDAVVSGGLRAGFSATVTAAAGGSYVWSSDNTDVATVTGGSDGNAVIHAKTPGVAKITATGSDASSSFYLTVTENNVEIQDGIYYKLVTQLTEQRKYLLVNAKSEGAAYALRAPDSGSTMTAPTTVPVRVTEYNSGIPYVQLTDGTPLEHIRWEYIEVDYSRGYGVLKDVNRTSRLAIGNIGNNDRTALQLQPYGTAGMYFGWAYSYDEGLYSEATVGSQKIYASRFYDARNATVVDEWGAVRGGRYDTNFYSKLYAYEETPLTYTVSLSDMRGEVAVGGTDTGTKIVKTWCTGKVEYFDLTTEHLSVGSGTAGTYTDVTVTFNGLEICADYTLVVGGTGNTISVPEGYYYRLTDGFEMGADFNAERKIQYLILNRNSRGDGKLMEADGYCDSVVKATDVAVSLDADGVPSVRSGSLDKEPIFQEWWYHHHVVGSETRDGWYLWQPNWGNSDTVDNGNGLNNHLRMTAGSGNVVITGDVNSNALKNPEYKESTEMAGYTTVSGVLRADNNAIYYLQYRESDDNFVGVNEENRYFGGEVYIYEKVFYNTAEVSALGTIGGVNSGSGVNAKTGTYVQIAYPDGTVENIPVTVGMLGLTAADVADKSASYELTGLTLTYQGVILTENYALKVRDSDTDPVYPEPGSVEVDKQKDTSEYVYEETGVARVDLSVSGVPMDKPVDVLLIVDTSASVEMYRMANGQTRIQAMRDATEALIDELAQPNADGSLPDISLAISEFNNYTYFSTGNTFYGKDDTGTEYEPFGYTNWNANGLVHDYASVYEMQNFNPAVLVPKSGTNYDVAFQKAYEIVSARKAAHPDREQIVIFMTDGICYQYNYMSYRTDTPSSALWGRWLKGTLTAEDLQPRSEGSADGLYLPATARVHFYNPDGNKQWMAEAIKGSPENDYKVIWNPNTTVIDGYNYSDENNLKYVKGLGATVYSIGFGIYVDGKEAVEISDHILGNMASDPYKFFKAQETEDLMAAFADIGHGVRKAATNAEFYDQMGEEFDLQMKAVTNSKGEAIAKRPTIQVKSYDVYKYGEIGTTVGGVFVTEEKVGQRKSNVPTILETVTFSDDGTEAYSSKKSGNIMTNGIINAYYFMYNTEEYDPDGFSSSIPAPETFRWNIGDITERELVLSYYVYLEDSMGEDGGHTAGIYDTNQYADIHYLNYQGEPRTQGTVSPELDWVPARVSYGFYLVNENGEIINSDGSGTSFAGKVVVGGQSGDQVIHLNTDNGVTPQRITLADGTVIDATLAIPEGYALYVQDPSATIRTNSGDSTGGRWDVDDSGTTYVDNGSTAVNSDGSTKTGEYDDTTVWFAVVYTGTGAPMTNKTVEATDDPNEFVLTLEAFAQGIQSTVTVTNPADIVLVLDHSASMRTPVGAPQVLQSGTWYGGEGQLTKAELDTTLGAHPGYYIAQNRADNYWYVLLYHTDNKWYGYKVNSTEGIIEYLYKNGTEAQKAGKYADHLDRLSWSSTSALPDSFVFYKTQYAVLYEAVKDFIEDLKDSGMNHRVAITGFCGSTFGGTVLYGTGYGNLHFSTVYGQTADIQKLLFQQALKSIQDPTQYASLQSSVEAIDTRYIYTCPAAGLRMGTDLFKANPVNQEERDRVMILFTDGIPNKKIGGDQNSTDNQTEIYNEIISIAKEAKDQSAKVYAISTTTLSEGADRSFLHYASSDYPDATNFANPGSPIEKQKYTMRAENMEDFGKIFNTITQEVVGNQVALDKDAVLREVLTDYFVLNPDDQVDVQVYTAAYNGDGTYATPVERTKDFTVKLLPEDSDRKDTIEVSGFDYAEEYVSSVPRTVNGKNYFGSKLIVKVRIKTRDGFWGGNNVPTNEPTTGIYDKNRVLAVDFPEPQVNVPINVEVTAKDKTVYYGGTNDTDQDGWEGDELLQQITVGTQTGANGQIVNGSTVTVTTVTNPDGSTTTTFVPEESWMDDFASMDWTDGSTGIESNLSNTQPGDYTYGVEVKPNSDGSQNNGENPGTTGNIAGRPTDSENASDTGHIYILVPELTFKDSVTDFGTPVNGYDFEGKDFVQSSVVWKDMEQGKTPGSGIPALDQNAAAPALKLTYTPENSVTQFAGDTEVNVTVAIGNVDITDLVYYKWQEDCTFGGHTDGMDISGHRGNSGSHEFWVHTTIAILPDTVVIDFGLPVDIDPLVNDLQGVANVTRKLTGIGNDFKSSKDFTFGDAAILSGNELVRYTLHTSNGMKMYREETFPYRGEYAINGETMTAESTITVIPATVIYYEDSFVNFSSWTKEESWVKDQASAWETYAGHTEVQDTDRPGAAQIGRDTNNLYGYDSTYTDESLWSMGSYHKFTADATHSGEASFTFKGKAFDIIALSSSTTGTILVNVYKNSAEGDLLKSFMVDTYYGYQYTDIDGDGEKEWNPTDPSNPNALYQVPVMKVDMETYGTYHVVITVSYNKFFDHGQYNDGSEKYDFMLDAVRIYDQANDGKNNSVIENAYVADGEGWPSYIELRNILISANDFDSLGNGEVNGIVFIDGISALTDDSASGEQGGIFTDPNAGRQAAIADYANFGPNNELYLAKGQGVSFGLKLDGQNVQNIHLALKSVGGTARVRVYGVDQSGSKTYALGSEDAAADISTATDLYYDITALRGSKAIVIVSSGDAILSVTNIKMTHTSANPAAQGQREQEIMLQRFQVSLDSAALALDSLTVEAVNPFVDVHEGDYYYSSVLWAAANGITSGTDATHFSPGAACSRAQVVMFLWRAAGSPEPKTDTHPFVDVHSDGYYYKAMLWAVEKGITAGVDETHFGPNEVCSRGQIVTFLWRAAGSPEPGMTEHPFTDVASGSYYHKAVLWAVENGITTGMAANSFCPAFTCTRGQVVTFLYGAYHK